MLRLLVMRIVPAKFVLTMSLLLVSLSTLASGDKSKRDLVLEYLQFVGVIESIDLQVEAMREEYSEYYSYLPNEYWDAPRVVEAFDNYKVSLLRGYVEAMEEDLSDEDLNFLVVFYASEEGRRVVELGRRLDPLMVAAASEAGKKFTAAFNELIENGTN